MTDRSPWMEEEHQKMLVKAREALIMSEVVETYDKIMAEKKLRWGSR